MSDLKKAKSLLIYVHGESFPTILSKLRKLLSEMEEGSAWEGNCIDPTNGYEWDSSSEEHATISDFMRS